MIFQTCELPKLGAYPQPLDRHESSQIPFFCPPSIEDPSPREEEAKVPEGASRYPE